MDNNFIRAIISPSVELIRNDNKVKRFYFLPWTLSVIFASVLLVYQVVYTYSVLLWKEDFAFNFILSLFHSSYVIEFAIATWIFVLCYIILLPVFEWWLIRYIASKENGSASRSDALWYWLVRFAPLFEFNNIFNMFKLMSIVNGFLFSLRFLWTEYLSILSIVFFIAFLFSILINVLTAYASYEIVLENKWVFEAISSSSRLALLNIKTTMKLYILMFIMNIKIIINFSVFLIFPLFWAFIIWFLSSQIFIAITFFILWAIFLFVLLLLWYMAAVLEVFTTSIWYNAYKQWKEKLAQTNISS